MPEMFGGLIYAMSRAEPTLRGVHLALVGQAGYALPAMWGRWRQESLGMGTCP